MSADNYIAVQQIAGRWFVWHESASNDMPYVPLDRARRFRFRFSAMRYARRIMASMMVVEYGIRELGGWDEWRDYYQSAVDDWRARYWETIDAMQKKMREERLT